MLQALVISQRSPDPNTQVGAAVVDRNNIVLGLGYNGLPRGIQPKAILWDRHSNDPLKTKYPYIVHAEKNAIYNASSSVVGCTLYVTLFPCNECMKDITQAGISKIVYLEDKYPDLWQTEAAKWMADYLDIPYSQHVWEENIKIALQHVSDKIIL